MRRHVSIIPDHPGKISKVLLKDIDISMTFLIIDTNRKFYIHE